MDLKEQSSRKNFTLILLLLQFFILIGYLSGECRTSHYDSNTPSSSQQVVIKDSGHGDGSILDYTLTNVSGLDYIQSADPDKHGIKKYNPITNSNFSDNNSSSHHSPGCVNTIHSHAQLFSLRI